MHHHRSATIAAAALVAGLFLCSASAEAACNALPSTASLAGNAPPSVVEFAQGILPYRGALGRIDRPEFAPPGAFEDAEPDEHTVTIGPDGCGAGVLEGVTSRNDLIITYVFEEAADGGRPRVLQLAAATQQPALAMLGLAEAKRGFVFNGVFPNDDVVLVVAEVAGKEELRLRVPVPTIAQMGFAETDDRPHFQNTRLIVTRRDATAPLGELVAKKCAGFVFATENKPLACIDEFYSSSRSACAVTDAAQDPFACNANTSFGGRTNFGKQCYPGSASQGNPKECESKPSKLFYVADDCGNLRLRFSWKSIISDAAGNKHPRALRGFSGISRTAAGANARIRIPGREFLASTRNKGGGGDPYKPKFKATPNSVITTAMDLSGVADKNRSTLWILPRVPVSYICAATEPEEACMGIVADQPACVCPAGRLCYCGPPIEPRYFACSGDPEYLYQPCTNSAHCGTGKCDMPARCVPEMSVWSSTPPQGSLCTGDGIAGGCSTDQEQCGYSLFELRDEPNTAVLREVSYILSDPAGKNRGVCTQDFTRTCGVPGSDGCVLGDGTDKGPCIGYYLEAGDVVP